MAMPDYKWTPPADLKDYNYWITRDAVNGIRQHLSPESKNRTDQEVAKVINRLVFQAFERNDTIEVVDAKFPSEKTVIAHLQPNPERRCYGVLRINRPNAHPPLNTVAGPGGVALAVITVLSEDVGSRNFETGRWAAPEYKAPDERGSRVVKIGDTAAGKKLQEMKNTVATNNKPVATIVTTPVIAEAPMHRKCYRVGCAANALDLPNRTQRPVCKQHLDEEIAAKRSASLPQRAKGVMTTSAITAREQFARSVFSQRPHINIGGPDGIQELMKKTFGIGMDNRKLSEIRDEVRAAMTGTQPQVAIQSPPVVIQPYVVPAPVPSSPVPVVAAATNGSVMAMAVELASAIEAEKTAKQRVLDLQSQLKQANADLDQATKSRESLFNRMQGI